MAGQRLSDRDALAGADFANDDLVLVFDTSANTTKKMTRTELLTSISGVLPNGDKGDITVSGAGSTWTIDNNVVTYAKMQDVSAQYRLLGRSSSGAGDVEEITSSANVFSILGAADYASVRTLLSLVPGTDVQSYSAILAAFAGAAAASDKLPYFTGASTVGVTDFTAFGRSLVDDANASAARTTLGLVIGTDVQAYSANTAAIAALSHTSGNGVVSNGSAWTSAPVIGAVSVQVFTGSGTYTPVSGMKYCIIECLGGGGGGGGTANSGATTGTSGGGGGGGSYARKVCTAADIGASKAVTIGAGGSGGSAGNNNGSAGGDTSVGSLCIGKGGSGGGGCAGGAAAAAGGAGGVAGTGDSTNVGYTGGDGWPSLNTTSIYGISGAGGAGAVLGRARAGVAAFNFTGSGPNGAANSGEGAYGGTSWGAGGAAAGGTGGSGIVIITEFF